MVEPRHRSATTRDDVHHGRDGDGSMPRLLVYLHLAMKQRALQSMLQSVLGGVEVTAVGRIADFDRALQSGQDAVLALPPVLEAKGMSPALQGMRHGASSESYALVAVDKEVQPGLVASVGALDLLGRAGTNDFVHRLLGAKPDVERVSKVEDLLPLLQLQRAECLLLPDRLLREVQEMTRLRLVKSTLPRQVPLPAVGVTGARGRDVLSAVRGLSRDACASLGVDTWQ
jgi:hypothetical protein